MKSERVMQAAKRQRGGFALGAILGLLVGLAVALGVALYITKAPIPFVNKVQHRTAEQDTAEALRNRNWDPNAPLSGKAPAPGASGVVTQAPTASAAGAVGAAAPTGLAAPGSAHTPASGATPAAVVGKEAGKEGGKEAGKLTGKDPAAILAGGTAPGADPFIYFVQTGAYTRSEDAEGQKAKLALMGQTARISEREQAGRTVYRVRLGPFPSRDEADALQVKLQEQSIEAQIVRVEKT